MGRAETAVWVYLLTFALPLPWEVGLLGLAFLGSWASLTATPCFPPKSLLAPFPLATVIALNPLISPDPSRSLHFSLALLPGCTVYLLICGYLESFQLVRLGLALNLVVCSLGGWLLGVAAVHPANLPQEWIAMSRLTAFKVPNDMVFFQVLLPFSLACLKRPFWQGMLAKAACVTAISLAVVYQSRLAVLTALAGSAVFFALQGKVGRSLIAMLLLTWGMVLVDGVFGDKLLAKFQASWTSRLPLWLAAWRMFLASPWVGHGVGSYALLVRNYLDMADLPSWIALDPRPIPWAHNLYLEVLAELGVLGFIALVFLWLSPFWNQPKPPLASQLQGFTCAAKAASFAFALSAFFELSLWRQWVGLVFFLIIGSVAATNKFQRGTLSTTPDLKSEGCKA
jgi:O-antigen ligase